MFPARCPIVTLGFLLLGAAAVRAHTFVNEPDLGQLIGESDLVVRGTITEDSHPAEGMLVATVRVDRALRGSLPVERSAASGATRAAGEELVFASDLNHGVRYAAGERAVIFLRGRAPECARAPCPLFSPQRFGNKFRITSFDPTGYDALVAGLPAAAAIADPALRTRALIDLFTSQRSSPEKAVRDYVERRLNGINARP